MNKLILLLIALFFIGSISHAQIISTLAGTGNAITSGDGGPAIEANCSPGGLWAGPSGVYFTDLGNGRVRRIAPDGIVTTIAGDGSNDSHGDSGPATAAGFYGQSDVAVDKDGNVYIAEDIGNKIRKIDPYGIITTVAGTGSAGYSGDNGPATDALLNAPVSICISDRGDIYFSEQNNHVIRMVDRFGIISTYAGNGASGYNGDSSAATNAMFKGPQGIALDSKGNLFVADAGNKVIREISTDGSITRFAGEPYLGYSGDGEPAMTAGFAKPTDVAVDAAGNVYVADENSRRVRMINGSGIINTIAGTGAAGFSGDGGDPLMAKLIFPLRLAINSNGFVYISDVGTNRIRYIHTTVGINDVAVNKNSISITPNPSDGNFAIHISGNVSSPASLQLINMLGQIVYTRKRITGNDMELNAGVPAGVYWLKLCNNSGEVYSGRVSVIK